MSRIEGYLHRGGFDWETGGLANILAALGVKAPHTGEPYTETFLIGVGGGVGGGYWLWEFGGSKCVVTGFRNDWQKYKGEFAERICARLGVPVEAKETGGKKQAEMDLIAALEAGRPVWATTSEAALSHRGLPVERAKHLVYGIVVYGFEDDRFVVDDIAREPVFVSREEMSFARGIIPYNKHRMLCFAAPTAEPDLKEAVTEAIRYCAQEMLNPPIRNFGLAAWEKWAELVNHPKDKKGWPTVLADPQDLEEALGSLYESALKQSNGTGGLRGEYAQFLCEASELLGNPALTDAAEQYRACEALWHDFHYAVVPETNPNLLERSRLVVRRAALLRTVPGQAAEELARIRDREAELKSLPSAITPDAQRDLFADLQRRLREIAAAEREAATVLQAAIG